MQNICHKANKEIKAIFRVSAFLNLEQAWILTGALFHQILDIVHWIGCFAANWVSNRIVKTHYRTLRNIYDTKTLSYEELRFKSEK